MEDVAGTHVLGDGIGERRGFVRHAPKTSEPKRPVTFSSWLRTRSHPIRCPHAPPPERRHGSAHGRPALPRACRPRSAAPISAAGSCAPRSTSSRLAATTTRRSRTSSAAPARAAPRSTRSSTTVKTRCTARCRPACARCSTRCAASSITRSPGESLTEVGVRAYVDCLVADPAAARIILLEGVGTSPEVNALRSRIRRELADLIRDLWARSDAAGRGQPAGGRDLGRRVRHPLRVDGAPRRDEPARRGARARSRARHRDRSRPRAATPPGEARHRHSRPHAAPARARALGGDRDLRRHRRRSCRRPNGSATTTARAASTSRVPVDVAAVRGGRYYDPLATFGALGAHTTTIRFAAHVLVLGYHHPLDDREALRHARRRHRRARDPRRRRRFAAGGVRAPRRAVRRPRRPRRRRDARAAGRAVASGARVSRRLLRLRRASSSSPARCNPTCRCGSAAGPTDRCAARSSSAKAGRRSGCARPSSRRCCSARARHRSLGGPLDPDRRDRAERAPARPRRRTRTRRASSWHASPTSARPASTSASCTTPPRTTANNSPPSPPSPPSPTETPPTVGGKSLSRNTFPTNCWRGFRGVR